MREYIHYGTSSFDIAKFKPIQNTERGYTKPRHGTGFWASPVDAKWGWKDWCESKDFRECKKENSFVFTLDPSARVKHLYSVDDVYELPGLETAISSTWYVPDYEKLAKQYDAIEIHISDEVRDRWTEGLYYVLYGWDCDSILIMNPYIIKEVKDEAA